MRGEPSLVYFVSRSILIYLNRIEPRPITENMKANFLLALPFPIRQKIYTEYLGFEQFDQCDFNSVNDLASVGEWSARHRRSNKPPLSTRQCFSCCLKSCVRCKHRLANQLFYVSKDVSEDARSIFYSRNRFSVDSDRHSGLRPLLDLTPTALKALRTLRVGVETGRERSEIHLQHVSRAAVRR